MKPRHTILFILSTLAGLALLACLFPSDGLRLGTLTLRFPSVQEALAMASPHAGDDAVADDTTQSLTPEELLELRQEELLAQREEEYQRFCRSNPSRLYMPDGDEAYLDSFFTLLPEASTMHLRIMHYGDSQIECDRISSFLRERFQEEFGGMGVGLVPALQTVPTTTLSSTITPEDAPQYLAFGPADMRGEDNFYGPMAKTTFVADSARVELAGIGGKDERHSRTYSRLTVLTKGPAAVSLLTSQDTILLPSTSCGEMYFHSITTRPSSKAVLDIKGPTHVMGIQMDGTSGINLDNIPMRGSSGQTMFSVDRASLTPFFARERVCLILLQYGGNSIPYLTTDKLPDLKATASGIVRLFLSLAPEAKVIFIGPSDMARIDEAGKVDSYPILPAADKALREGVNEAGGAFWSMYDSMGGRSSMARWVEASPQLAGSDYVHFTPLGARRVASMFYDTLQLYYRYYRFRMGLDEEEGQTQSETTGNPT